MFSMSDLPTVVMYNAMYNIITCDVLNHLSIIIIHYNYKLDMHFVMRTNSCGTGIEQQ